MNVSITKIGTHQIYVRDNGAPYQLVFEDGVRLAMSNIDKALIQSIVRGVGKIEIIISDDLPLYAEEVGEKKYKLMSAFYIGLLEPLFKQVRDQKFPNIKIDVNRNSIVDVNQQNKNMVEDLMRVFVQPVGMYQPLENFLMDRISIGLSHKDGSVTMVRFGEDRKVSDMPDDEEQSQKLKHYIYRYFKAMDVMFHSNLKCATVDAPVQGVNSITLEDIA